METTIFLKGNKMKNREYIKHEIDNAKKYAFCKSTKAKIVIKLEGDDFCQSTKTITLNKGDLAYINQLLKEYIKGSK